MKIFLALLLCSVLFSCGGSLSDEQRKQMHQKMEDNKIIRVTEVEIMEAAFAEGRETAARLDSFSADSSRLESFLEGYQGKVHFLRPGDSGSHILEKQLIDAYLNDPSGTFQDNIQELRNSQGEFDTLLYTKPVTRKLPDGRQELIGVWNIWLPKKTLVVEISRQR